MAKGWTIELKGARELQAALTALPQAIAKRQLREAVREAAAPVQSEMKRRANRFTGAAAESISIASVRVEDFNSSVAIGPTQAHNFKLRFAEFGTARQPATPWARPAWEETKGQALEILRARLWDRLAKAARALAKRSAA